VKQDPSEAIKWYRKAAAAKNTSAMVALAEMYAAGEGTKADRPAAFVLFFHAALLSAKGAQPKASDLLRQMDKPEIKRTEKKLREQNLDPTKVFATIEAGAPS
jgi:TPR repeat protein